MELKLFIEQAAAIAGDQKTLARAIGITPDYLAHAKAGRRGLPLAACLSMAELLAVDPVLVIYASALSANRTKKKPASLPPAFKNPKSENLATPDGVYAPLIERRKQSHRRITDQRGTAFEAMDMTEDAANFYKLLFPVPIV